MVNSDALRLAVESHFEWLAVRENGRTLSLRSDEIEVNESKGKTRFGFVGEKGFRSMTVRSVLDEGDRITIELSAEFGGAGECLRLIARESAAALAANIEFARLQKANEAARMITESVPDSKVLRIDMNAENGRLAQITISDGFGKKAGVLSDVTASQTHEMLLSASLKWREKLRSRQKDPIEAVWIAGEKRQARSLQKMSGLLNPAAKSGLAILEFSQNENAPAARKLRLPKLSELWREKAPKLRLPESFEPSETARAITALSPEKIDVVFSRHGETLRFLGLPFVRVRRMMGREKAWFGTETDRRPLNASSFESLIELVGKLEINRSPQPPVKRHELYRLAPEAWLESILRRNIKLLDSNLILSPIYNQFRSSNDKIDLLAIRRDGRLVIIELKTSPDREMIFQAADYWRKIELQRRGGELARARLFGDLPILDKPALVYAVAPALSFHSDFEFFAKTLSTEIELWRWELHENWRGAVKVLSRKNYTQRF